MSMLTFLVCAFVLLSGWTAAWLEWLFRGEIRHAIVRWLLPPAWTQDVVGMDGDEVIPVEFLSSDDLSAAIAASYTMPAFLRGILTCPRCMSAHVAGAGALLLTACRAWSLLGFWLGGANGCQLLSEAIATALCLPLVWATGAFVGYKLFIKYESKSS